jgi:hypothetical protein
MMEGPRPQNKLSLQSFGVFGLHYPWNTASMIDRSARGGVVMVTLNLLSAAANNSTQSSALRSLALKATFIITSHILVTNSYVSHTVLMHTVCVGSGLGSGGFLT